MQEGQWEWDVPGEGRTRERRGVVARRRVALCCDDDAQDHFQEVLKHITLETISYQSDALAVKMKTKNELMMKRSI